MKTSIIVLLFFLWSNFVFGSERQALAISQPEGFGFSVDANMTIHLRAPKDDSLKLATGTTRKFKIDRVIYHISWPYHVYILHKEEGKGVEGYIHPDVNRQRQKDFLSGGGELPIENDLVDVEAEVLYLVEDQFQGQVGTQIEFSGLPGISESLTFLGASPKNINSPLSIQTPVFAPMDRKGLNYARLMMSILKNLRDSIKGGMKHNQKKLRDLFPSGKIHEYVTWPNARTTKFSCATQKIRDEVELECNMSTRIFGSSVIDKSAVIHH